MIIKAANTHIWDQSINRLSNCQAVNGAIVKEVEVTAFSIHGSVKLKRLKTHSDALKLLFCSTCSSKYCSIHNNRNPHIRKGGKSECFALLKSVITIVAAKWSQRCVENVTASSERPLLLYVWVLQLHSEGSRPLIILAVTVSHGSLHHILSAHHSALIQSLFSCTSRRGKCELGWRPSVRVR